MFITGLWISFELKAPFAVPGSVCASHDIIVPTLLASYLLAYLLITTHPLCCAYCLGCNFSCNRMLDSVVTARSMSPGVLFNSSAINSTQQWAAEMTGNNKYDLMGKSSISKVYYMHCRFIYGRSSLCQVEA